MINEKVRHTNRSVEDKKRLTNRLHVIEGQVRGVLSMVEEDRYCGDILIQISAIDQSLKSLGKEILKKHLATCVVTDIQNNHLEVLDEVMDLFKKLD